MHDSKLANGQKKIAQGPWPSDACPGDTAHGWGQVELPSYCSSAVGSYGFHPSD